MRRNASMAPHDGGRLGAWILWIAVFLGGCGIAWLIPPFQSPDENAHLGRAALIADGRWLLERKDGSDSGGYFDKGLIRFQIAHVPMIEDPRARMTPEARADVEALRWDRQELFFTPIAGTGYYLPVVYLPQALALWVGERLDLSVLNSYRLARLMALAATLGLLAAACRILKPNVLTWALMLLPMTVFQAVSPTLDGLASALAVLTLALFLRAVEHPAGRTAPPAWGLAVALLLLCTSRIHVLPLLALPFYLAWRRRSWRECALAALLLMACVGWVLFTLRTTVDTRIAREHSTTFLVGHYLRAPWEFVQVIWRTVTDPGIREFYLQSFIGKLGWLDTLLAPRAYTWLWAGLGACAVASLSVVTLRQDAGARAMLLLASAGSVALVFFALLVTWNAHPAATIQGVQGRYFLVPAMTAAAALSGTAAPRTWSPWWRSTPLLLAFAAAALWSLVAALLLRYH